MRINSDIVVVGLGHAGCEAALAGARMGLSVVAITLRRDRIGLMSCNPAIGGTAKGHLVKELDALGGAMAAVADRAGTHFKTLNGSKGPAVRASRVLCDRDAYAAEMQAEIRGQPGLEVVEGEAAELLVEDGRVCGVVLSTGERLATRSVIVTTGTFLQALMHVGEEKVAGGRLGDAAATGLSGNLRTLGFELGRFKTGTPARLLRGSIDYTRCERQPGDAPSPLSLRTRRALEGGAIFPRLPEQVCHITYTGPATHAVVRENLTRSPLFKGDITGRGPRYCPSLEDKVVRFSERERHQVFLEPEGAGSELVYPAGLSTSLPADAQLAFLRTIPGLEQVEVARYGYAVEYDFVPPTQLWPTLETRRVAGLFFAGQLNGTSGYEEAAFQGLFAGIQAGLRARGEPPLELRRDEAHGAVLIDELVSKGVDEPFRMFTSRSEHRLKLREGNAEGRLRGHGHRVGLISEEELRWSSVRMGRVAAELKRLETRGFLAKLRQPEVTYRELIRGDGGAPDLPADLSDEVETEVKYAGYIKQADRAAARSSTGFDALRIPETLDFSGVRGLSREAAERLQRARPGTLGQARRLRGLTPAALDLLVIHLRRGGSAFS